MISTEEITTVTANSSTVNKDIHEVSTSWKGKMHFESLANNHIVHLDKLEKHGGEDLGPRPKQLILSAMGGCLGMEIISTLEKMRVKIESLDLDVTGELSETQPKVYTAVHMLIKVKCETSCRPQIERAISLSNEKYCGVMDMVRHFAKVTMEIRYL